MPADLEVKAKGKRQKSYRPGTISFRQMDTQTDHYKASTNKWQGPN